MRALWNGWVANAGTYEVNGDTLRWTQQRNALGAAVTNAPTTKFTLR